VKQMKDADRTSTGQSRAYDNSGFEAGTTQTRCYSIKHRMLCYRQVKTSCTFVFNKQSLFETTA